MKSNVSKSKANKIGGGNIQVKKRPHISFVLLPGSRPGYVLMRERDESGMFGPLEDSMEFKLKDLKVDPISLLHHEFSEREIKRSIKAAGENQHAKISRFTKTKGKEVELPIPHIMTSHHSDSGLLLDGRLRRLTPIEFKKFIYEDTYGISDLYPNQHRIVLAWNDLAKRGNKAKSRREQELLLAEAKRLRDLAEGEVEEKRLQLMNEVIRDIERYLHR